MLKVLIRRSLQIAPNDAILSSIFLVIFPAATALNVPEVCVISIGSVQGSTPKTQLSENVKTDITITVLANACHNLPALNQLHANAVVKSLVVP
jgi:hypothetical protein